MGYLNSLEGRFTCTAHNIFHVHPPKMTMSPFPGDQLEKNGSSFNGEFFIQIPGILKQQFDGWLFQLDDEPKRYCTKMVGNHQTFIKKIRVV